MALMSWPHSHKRKSVALISYGCAKNLVDSEVMLGYLSGAGYAILPEPEKADVVILNTCGFITPAREEAARAIEDALSLKKRKKRPLVVAAGCYVERYKNSLEQAFPEVDIWLGVKDYDKIVQAIEGKPFRAGRRTFLCSHTTPRLLSTPSSWAYIKISEGCSHKCSFCAIPLIKGPYRSRPIDSIIEEARQLVHLGVREINLISQDTTSYGRDRGMKNGLAKLLEKLSSLPRLGWIRILYGYPEEISINLLDVMTATKICSYFDLPFQHADPSILKVMGRSMDSRRAMALLDRIRSRVSDASIRTSLIVGFPGEGKREFLRLKDFVREARFDHLGVFTYSPEEGTPAFRLGDPVAEGVKIRRQQEIMDLQAEISFANNKRYLGQRVDVLIESTSPSAFLRRDGLALRGRGRFQAPEVDGVIYVRAPSPCGRRLRVIEKVEITAVDVYDLHGMISR
ncbi:MAG: 30S ribosomal protein S12 methylthiotransferase RimO [Clostridiales bacterium]|nr:30S ribosomal protein S12 methylthiotransferase RimO [Clostridiales bacterium]